MAEFATSSNPTTVKATFVGYDDSDIISAFVGVGFGKGSYGDQIIPWTPTSLTERETHPDASKLTPKPILDGINSTHYILE